MGIAGVRWLWLSSLGTSLFAGQAHAQAVPPAPSSPPPAGREWVRVTLPQTGREARLDVFEGGPDKDPDDSEGWRNLCIEPCAMWIPSGTHLRVTGNFRKADPFPLPRSATGVTLRVKPSALDARGLGITITAISAPFMTIGALFYSKEGPSSGSGAGPGTVAVAGLVGVVAGVTIIALSGSSKVFPEATPAARSTVAAPAVSLGRGLSLGLDGIRF